MPNTSESTEALLVENKALGNKIIALQEEVVRLGHLVLDYGRIECALQERVMRLERELISLSFERRSDGRF